MVRPIKKHQFLYLCFIQRWKSYLFIFFKYSSGGGGWNLFFIQEDVERPIDARDGDLSSTASSLILRHAAYTQKHLQPSTRSSTLSQSLPSWTHSDIKDDLFFYGKRHDTTHFCRIMGQRSKRLLFIARTQTETSWCNSLTFSLRHPLHLLMFRLIGASQTLPTHVFLQHNNDVKLFFQIVDKKHTKSLIQLRSIKPSQS